MARHRWIRNGALALGAVCLVLGLLEAGLRGAGVTARALRVNPYLKGRSWAEPDEALGWRNREGVFASIEAGHARMRFAADGRRVDPGGMRRDGLPEVLIVGGSFAQGYGVGDGETFAARLNARFPCLHVVNYGTGGYSTLQALRMAKRQFAASGRRGPVRGLIYGLIAHHAARNVAAAEWVRYLTTSDGRLLSPPYMRLRDGRFAAHAGGPVPVWPLETRSALVRWTHDALLALVHDASQEEAEKVTLALAVRMHALARRRGVPFLTAALTDLAAGIRAGLGKAAVPFADCHVPDWWRTPGMRVGGWGHPSPALHRRYAACLSVWIARMVPEAGRADCRDPARASR